MIDLTDPFGKYRRIELEYNNRQLAERNEQLEKDAEEHHALDDFLIEKLNATSKELANERRAHSATRREHLKLQEVYTASEEARKNLGEKNAKLQAENNMLTDKLGELCKEISDLKTQTMEATA